jgi:LmbE family N-acetylglucosaminyl deacetylase
MKVLAIGSHIDDLEYSMGGTLLKHRDAGDEIILAITHADDNLAGEVLIRVKEQYASANILKSETVYLLKGKAPMESKVADLDKVQPGIMYFPFEQDHHQHHVETAQIGMAVARNFGITSIQYIVQRSYSYYPNYYRVINFEDKKNLVSVFKSQNGRRPKFVEIMETQNRYFGSFIPGNGHYAEGFVIHRMLQL